jgi:hypothetical protein
MAIKRQWLVKAVGILAVLVGLFIIFWQLARLHMGYFSGRPPGMVMGTVVSDATPVKKSDISTRGRRFPVHQFTHPKWCPIFRFFPSLGGLAARA